MAEFVFLRRYEMVVTSKLPARYRITRSIPVAFDKSASIEELWEMYRSWMKEYRMLLRIIDTGRYSPHSIASWSSLFDLKVAIVEKMP